MMPPTSIDGTDITGATIDGQDVQEITVDGQTVFSAVFEHTDDFATDTSSDYTFQDIGDDTSSSSWTFSGGTVTSNDRSVAMLYDVSSATSGGFDTLSIEIDVVSTGDDDGIGIGMTESSIDTVYGVGLSDDFLDNSTGDIEGIYEFNVGAGDDGNATTLADWSKSLSATNSLRMEYDGSTIKGFYNGTQELTASLSGFTPGFLGLTSFFMSPGVEFDNLTITVE